MRHEVEKQAKRPVSLQAAADALERGMADGSLTPEGARDIINHHEATYPPVSTDSGEEVINFGMAIQWVIDNPEPL